MKTAAKSGFHKSAAWAALSLLGATGALLSGTIQPAAAQALNNPNNSDPLQDVRRGNDNSSDPFSSSGGGGMSGFLQLMHQAQQGQIRDGSQFDNDQQNSINSTAADFRNKQRQLLQQQNSPGATITPAAVPEPSQQPGSN
jgi:hypothetical protein